MPLKSPKMPKFHLPVNQNGRHFVGSDWFFFLVHRLKMFLGMSASHNILIDTKREGHLTD